MGVVSNTSPVCNLAILGWLELLPRRYTRVAIPGAVALELRALTHPAGRAAVESAFSAGWLVVEAVSPASRQAIRLHLDAGETEAIQLAVQTRADLLLMDERRGRASARALGIPVAGVLGELLHARHAGWIESLSREIQRLRSEAGFHLAPEIERFVLSQSGE